MSRFAVAYTLLSMWLSGWLVGTFGLAPAAFLTVILLLPALASWRLSRRDGQVKRRELFFLCVLTAVAVVGVLFVVTRWFETSTGRLAVFHREYYEFLKTIDSMPEFENVEVSYTDGKGGSVYLRGAVDSQGSHNKLITLLENTMQHSGQDYSDRVDYPGKPDSKKSANEQKNPQPPGRQ